MAKGKANVVEGCPIVHCDTREFIEAVKVKLIAFLVTVGLGFAVQAGIMYTQFSMLQEQMAQVVEVLPEIQKSQALHEWRLKELEGNFSYLQPPDDVAANPDDGTYIAKK